MVATFDGLKDRIKSIASSPMSPTHITAGGRAADSFLALNQYIYIYIYIYIYMYIYLENIHVDE